MENATKALIIAAAILIAIVLISLGVFVLGNGTQLVKENSDMTATQVTAYNSEWEAYFGDHVTGTKVKQLINAKEQHNRNAEDDSKKITLTGVQKADDVQVGKAYSVKVDSNATNAGYTTSGLISTISITPK